MKDYVNIYISSLCDKSLENVNWKLKKGKTLCINILNKEDLGVLSHFIKRDILYNNEKLFFQNLDVVKEVCQIKVKIFADNEKIREELLKYRPNLPYFDKEKEEKRKEQELLKKQQIKEQELLKKQQQKFIFSKWNRNPNIIEKYGLIKEQIPKNLYKKIGIVIIYDYLGKDIENNLIKTRLKKNLRTWIIGRESDYNLDKIQNTQKLYVSKDISKSFISSLKNISIIFEPSPQPLLNCLRYLPTYLGLFIV